MATGNLLVDTSILIDYLRKKNKRKTQFYKIVGSYNLYVSAITLFELYAGAKDEQKMRDVKNITEYLEILPFTRNAAEKAGEIYIMLRDENKVIEVKDLFIAATALSHDFPIMTLNVKHFNRIPELSVL